MNMIYNVEDKPKFGQVIVFAFQQLLAIIAATIAVPIITNGNAGLEGEDAMSIAAALFGAGVGTLVYVLFTRAKSPVFLGSSFAFLGSMAAAFAGAASVSLGYVGIILGAVMAGLVYVVIAILVKFVGVEWLNKLMPPVVIGPTVAIIGLSLAGNAVGDLQKSNIEGGATLIAILCGLITLVTVTICSTYGKKMAKLIPFIIGILVGYVVASIFTAIGYAADVDALKIVNYSTITSLFEGGVTFSTFVSVPQFTFLKAFGGFSSIDGAYIGTVAAAYIPVAFVVFAEHVADHKNISSIIGRDLLEKPGLHRTLLGDGVGSMVGAFFGGCPNTTYGESVACVAITRNASVVTIITTACMAIVVSFVSPFIAFLNSIPSCVMGGVCMALYGFIAVSGLKMLQKVDLNLNRNLFVASTILIAGIGGLSLTFGKVTITSIATALILGIIVNTILAKEKAE
ncbi:MAG: uracil-xanthine permease [Clostridia bacterium]|nr:uracil-xanthine permease [Oscillospiraceae bacterium]MBR6763430.1 uracil-xanthine permease [Clostridia bacterium]